MKSFITFIILSLPLSVFTTEPIKVETKTFNSPIAGKVLEKMNAATYTYLKLQTKNGEKWIAVPQIELAIGTEVEMLKPIPMFGFESKTLKRKFDEIYFGVLKSQRVEVNAEKEKK